MLGRSLLRALGALGVILTTFGAAAGQTIELKVSHYLPPNHTIQKMLEDWGRTLDQRSAGRLKLAIYPAAQLGPVQRQLDLARNGQADIAVGLIGATPGRYPLTELASLPFTWPKDGAESAITSKRLTKLAPKYLAGEYQGLHVLLIGAPPSIGFFTARRAILGIGDLKGLKIRFQGEQNAMMLRELGSTPLQVPPGEIADGMSKGVIDGALFNYEAAESFGLASVTKHVLEPGFTTGALVMAMNAQRYDALPADLKAIVDETTGVPAAEALGKRWDAAEAHGREYMLAGKVAVDTLPPAEVEVIRVKLAPLVAAAVGALEKSGKPAQAFLDDYRR